MTKRVLISQVMHETNTFSRLATDLACYRARYCHRGEDVAAAFAGTRTEIGAFLEAARRHGWSVVHPLAANATPSGPVTNETWRTLSRAVLDPLEGGAPVDGVLLALHGAMVTETTDDAEGELLAAIRDRVGPDTPVAVTLDLHANVTGRMAENANILIAYRTYPHVDQYERGLQAAGLLQRAMAGEISPHVVVARGAMLDGADHGRTQGGPMKALLAKAAAFEREPGVLAVSIQAGFPWSDIEEAGPSVAVTAEGNTARGRRIAESLVDDMWETRHTTTITTVGVAEAVAAGARPDASGKPLVIADFADNPGGGGYGDATKLLGGMIEANLENAAFATIADREAVRACVSAGLGQRVTLALGGRIDPAFGPPLEVSGKVMSLTDGSFVCDGPMWKGLKLSMGPTAVLRVGGLDVVITTARLQVTDVQTFLSVGIEAQTKSVVAVKSAHHFRAAFEPIARAVILADDGGLTSRNFNALTYSKVRRPVFPLDLD